MYNSTQEILRLTTMTKRIIMKKIYKTQDFSPHYLGQSSFLQTFLIFPIHHLVDKAQMRLVMATNVRKYNILKKQSNFRWFYFQECAYSITSIMTNRAFSWFQKRCGCLRNVIRRMASILLIILIRSLAGSILALISINFLLPTHIGTFYIFM